MIAKAFLLLPTLFSVVSALFASSKTKTTWQLVANGPHFFDPKYHPQALAPPPPTPTPRPITPHEQSTLDHLFRAHKHRVGNEGCIANWNGRFIGVPCDKKRANRLVSPSPDDKFEVFPIEYIYDGDFTYAPYRIKDWMQMAEEEGGFPCWMAFNSWKVPSHCDDTKPPKNWARKYRHKNKEGRQWLLRAAPGTPSSPPHYYGDPDSSRKLNPFYPTAEEKEKYFVEGKDVCFPRNPVSNRRETVPMNAVQRAIKEKCAKDAAQHRRAPSTDKAIVPGTNVASLLYWNDNWDTFTLSDGNASLVRVSLRQTAEFLGDHWKSSKYWQDEKICQKRFWTTATKCANPVVPLEKGSGVSIYDGGLLTEIDAMVLDKSEWPEKLAYVKP